MPGVLSATLGIWVGVGSRDEHPDVAGSSHFLEHLLFKGTTTRSALEIATAMDAVGGEMNAFTAKEHTCYYANVLASDLPLAVTLLSDLVTEACNTAADLESERTVVLEEIAMRDDEPSDAVHDLFSETLFGDTPARPLGARHGRVDRGAHPRRRRRLVPRAGTRCLRSSSPPRGASTTRRCSTWSPPRSATVSAGARARRRCGSATVRPTRPARPAGLIARRTEQTHLLLGTPGHGPAGRAPVCRRGARRRRRRWHELAAVPGDPGEARSGLQRRVGAVPLRGGRGPSRCTRAARRSACPRCCG